MRWPLLFLITFATPAAAQRLTPEPPRLLVPFESRYGTAPAFGNDHAGDGALFGGIVLGLGGIALGYGLCQEGDNGHPTTFGYCAPHALLGGLITATIGTILGALIGSAFPKVPPR